VLADLGAPVYIVGNRFLHKRDEVIEWRQELEAGSFRRSWLTFGTTKIGSFDPPLTSAWTAYPTHPLLALLHPPVEGARS
jgi:hypothetical protein